MSEEGKTILIPCKRYNTCGKLGSNQHIAPTPTSVPPLVTVPAIIPSSNPFSVLGEVYDSEPVSSSSKSGTASFSTPTHDSDTVSISALASVLVSASAIVASSYSSSTLPA
jgi:hypothetical protein